VLDSGHGRESPNTSHDAGRPVDPSRGRVRQVVRHWADGPGVAADLSRPRDDILLERQSADGEYVQDEGPFNRYRRTLARDGDTWVETTDYRFALPWFAWLLALPVRFHLGRRWSAPGHGARHEPGHTPWWSPPDRLDGRQLAVLGLLAAASMSSAFINTLFTQTVNFAADDFGVGDTGVGIGASIVRAGIVLMLPVALLADRVGRRRVVTAVAVAAPLVSACGALAPNFAVLVATQALGRPLGLALDFLVAVVAAEEMPRNSRAYAVSVLAMASGLGAGLAVMALPLTDLGPSTWRYVYLVTLVWLAAAVSIARHLPETRRFERPHVIAPPIDRGRFASLGMVALLSNVFVAPASLFQNGYLEDVRGFSGTEIAVFTVSTATPAGIGLILGGRSADLHGRRRVVATALPVVAVLVVVSYSVGGAVMWFSVFAAGVVGGIVYPALAVYRTELFPTGSRSLAAGLLTAAALIGGIAGLLGTGRLLDAGWPHGRVMLLLASAQIVVVVIVLRWFPETAHRELEELNPVDATGGPPAATSN
jgi:MFS family permease